LYSLIVVVFFNNNYLNIYIIMDSKQEIIGNIYYNESGFGSKATTLKDAREKDKSISVKDAEEFFKQNVEI